MSHRKSEVHRSIDQTKTAFAEVERLDAYEYAVSNFGPSQTLMAFLNYDKTLGSELGLEKLDSLSAPTQHEVFCTKVDRAGLESMAVESLADTVGKISAWVQGAGYAGFLGLLAAAKWSSASVKTKAIIGGVSLAAIYSGKIVSAINHQINDVVLSGSMPIFVKGFETALRVESSLIAKMPTEFTYEAWNSFEQELFHDGSETQKLLEEVDNDTFDVFLVGRGLPNKAAWTPEKFKNATEWLISAGKKLHDAETKSAAKLDHIESWLKSPAAKEDAKTAKAISRCMSDTYSVFECSHDIINHVGKELTRVGRLFKEAQ